MDIKKIQDRFAKFAKDREWEQFHSPKNISMALSVEASELLEIFQWMKEEDSKNPDQVTLNKIKDEVADVLLYTFRIAELLKIDIQEAIESKIEQNSKKYPVEKAKGNSKKYTEF